MTVPRFSPRTRLLGASLAALCLTLTAQAETYTYKVDFGVEGSPVADGYQSVDAKTLSATPGLDVGLQDEKGAHPIHLCFDCDVGGYSLGDTKKPLTTDGIYTFGSNGKEPKDIPFTISGLPPKAKVSLYAVRAWNGAGRAAFISLGQSSLTDISQTPDDIEDPQSVSDFVSVAERQVAGADGKISGIFSNSDGSTIRPEGQWGAMILVVETP